MRLFEFILNENSVLGNIWYHGSPTKFDKFDLTAKRINRGSNPTGVYLTKNIDLAKRYATETGYVYIVKPDVSNTFIDKQTPITKELEQSYKSALMKYTTYKEDWIDISLIPQLHQNNRIKSDIDGEVKTATYRGAGYDSYMFLDMFDESLVVFDPANVTITGIA